MGVPPVVGVQGPSFTLRLRRLLTIPAGLLAVALATLVIIRMLMPVALKHYVNERFSEIPDYDGQIDDVDLQLLRGGYTVWGAKITKTGGKVPAPFFSAPRMDFTVEWEALVDGALVAKAVFHEPRLNIVAGPTDDTSQTGMGKEWRIRVEELFPLRFDRVEVNGGEVHFRNFHKKPEVDLYLHHLDMVATNITNSKKRSEKSPVKVDATADSLGDGNLKAHLALDPLNDRPTFDLNVELTNVNLVALNPFFQAYGKFDVHSGTLNLFTEIAAEDGRYVGYVKPLFHHLAIFDLEKDRHDIRKLFWEGVLGTAAESLKNQPTGQLGARIPVEGTFEKGRVDVFGSIGSLLRNAFVRALLPTLDNSVEAQADDHAAGHHRR